MRPINCHRRNGRSVVAHFGSAPRLGLAFDEAGDVVGWWWLKTIYSINGVVSHATGRPRCGCRGESHHCHLYPIILFEAQQSALYFSLALSPVGCTHPPAMQSLFEIIRSRRNDKDTPKDQSKSLETLNRRCCVCVCRWKAS